MNEFENENVNISDEAEPTVNEVTEETVKETVDEAVEETVESESTAAYKVSKISFEDENSENLESNEAVSKKPKKTLIACVYDYIETFCTALALMMLLFLFVFRYVSVDGQSMRTTLEHNDKLIISNLFYTPETGDIVVINPESHGDDGKPIIKRVIATEGQTVFIDYKNWEVYVDGVKLDEPYIEEMHQEEIDRYGEGIEMDRGAIKYQKEFTVGKGKVFVMGDNRNHSTDSRFTQYGEMGVNRILGRVIIRITPEFGFVD